VKACCHVDGLRQTRKLHTRDRQGLVVVSHPWQADTAKCFDSAELSPSAGISQWRAYYPGALRACACWKFLLSLDDMDKLTPIPV
jgi:hypothetical protein